MVAVDGCPSVHCMLSPLYFIYISAVNYHCSLLSHLQGEQEDLYLSQLRFSWSVYGQAERSSYGRQRLLDASVSGAQNEQALDYEHFSVKK